MRFNKSVIVLLLILPSLTVLAVVGHRLQLPAFDKPPFILLNLMLSFQAAFTGPVLLIAANRASARDRDLAEHTFQDTEEHKDLLLQNTQLTFEIKVLTENQDKMLSAISDLVGVIHAHIQDQTARPDPTINAGDYWQDIDEPEE